MGSAATIKEGTRAPNFELLDKDGIPHSPKSFKEKYLVVYFYPKDDTPGCTLEAQGFTAQLKKFQKLNTAVVGISGGDEKTKATFCKKFDLEVLLISDADFKVAKSYDSYGKKKFMGREYTGILRKTFVLDDKRNIVKIYDDVKADGHAEEVLEFIKTL